MLFALPRGARTDKTLTRKVRESCYAEELVVGGGGGTFILSCVVVVTHPDEEMLIEEGKNNCMT